MTATLAFVRGLVKAFVTAALVHSVSAVAAPACNLEREPVYTAKEMRFTWNLEPREEPSQWQALDSYTLDVQYGLLRESQFTKLKTRFRSSTLLRYDSNREYGLLDFMPPVFQALFATQFRTYAVKINWPEYSRLKADAAAQGGASMELDDLMRWTALDVHPRAGINCWGFINAALRSLFNDVHAVELGWISRTSAYHRFSTREKFLKIREEDIRAGDVMMVTAVQGGSGGRSGESFAQHAAMIVDKKLVIEKTDSSDNDMTRVAWRSDVQKKMRLIFGDNHKIEYFRLKRNAIIQSIGESELLDVWAGDYSNYLSAGDRSRLMAGMDLTDNGNMRNGVYLYVHINVVERNGRFVLDPNNPISQRFVKPSMSNP